MQCPQWWGQRFTATHQTCPQISLAQTEKVVQVNGRKQTMQPRETALKTYIDAENLPETWTVRRQITASKKSHLWHAVHLCLGPHHCCRHPLHQKPVQESRVMKSTFKHTKFNTLYSQGCNQCVSNTHTHAQWTVVSQHWKLSSFAPYLSCTLQTGRSTDQHCGQCKHRHWRHALRLSSDL